MYNSYYKLQPLYLREYDNIPKDIKSDYTNQKIGPLENSENAQMSTLKETSHDMENPEEEEIIPVNAVINGATVAKVDLICKINSFFSNTSPSFKAQTPSLCASGNILLSN